MRKLSRSWKIFLCVALLAGALLRVLYVEDMEYKEDEQYNYTLSQTVGKSEPWPWFGMPSGVYIPNPGASVWVFVGLAKLTGAREPLELERALQLFSLLGIALVIPFALSLVKEQEREPWLWAAALALVNPFAVLYERKLWPEPFLPFFIVLLLAGWWRRDRIWGALVWGLLGAALGQIHMSGFFLAGGLFAWTALLGNRVSEPRKTAWSAWFAGSLLGALPLIPWAAEIIRHPTHEAIVSGWNEISQLKFWVFWITDPLGLHLGNPLGLLRGESEFAQISDFIRYPVISGHATYLCGLAHLTIAVGAVLIFGRAGARFWRERARATRMLLGLDSNTAFVTAAAFWGFGFLMTATSVVIRRYYMVVSFPLEFVFLTWLALSKAPTRGDRAWLGALWASQLLISACFVGYVHVNNGATQGDYGLAYHVIRDQHLPLKIHPPE